MVFIPNSLIQRYTSTQFGQTLLILAKRWNIARDLSVQPSMFSQSECLKWTSFERELTTLPSLSHGIVPRVWGIVLYSLGPSGKIHGGVSNLACHERQSLACELDICSRKIYCQVGVDPRLGEQVLVDQPEKNVFQMPKWNSFQCQGGWASFSHGQQKKKKYSADLRSLS